jgi:hypothetical protein
MRPSCIIVTGADSRKGLRMVKPHPEEALIRRVWARPPFTNGTPESTWAPAD